MLKRESDEVDAKTGGRAIIVYCGRHHKIAVRDLRSPGLLPLFFFLELS